MIPAGLPEESVKKGKKQKKPVTIPWNRDKMIMQNGVPGSICAGLQIPSTLRVRKDDREVYYERHH